MTRRRVAAPEATSSVRRKAPAGPKWIVTFHRAEGVREQTIVEAATWDEAREAALTAFVNGPTDSLDRRITCTRFTG